MFRERRFTSKGKAVSKPIYNSKDWVLGECKVCGKLNYVEPHGTTAHCTSAKCRAGDWTEHASLLYAPPEKRGSHHV